MRRPCRSLLANMAVLASAASCSSSSPSLKVSTDGGADGDQDASETGMAGRCQGATLSDGGMCPAKTLGSLTIIGSAYSVTGSAIVYGTAPALWDVYGFAGPGQSVPAVTPSASTLAVAATLTQTAAGPGWAGVAVSVDGAACLNEADPANYARGIQFTLAGDLGGCALYLDAVTSANESAAADPCRGACLADAGACVAPTTQITSMGMLTIPNMAFAGGSPPVANTTLLIGFRWRLQTPGTGGGTGCAANITISNVNLLGL